jgi:hypothetical protein
MSNTQDTWPTSQDCAAAIKVLVAHGFLRKATDEDTYLRLYDAMREALIAAAPQDESTQG